MILPWLAAVVALIGSLIVGRAAPYLVAAVRPVRSVPILTVAAIGSSLAAGVALSAIGAGAIAGLTSLSADVDWSPVVVSAMLPIPRWVGLPVAVVVLGLLSRAFLEAGRIAASIVKADRISRSLRLGGAGPVVIVDDPAVDAFTVAGIHGCVVMTTGLLNQMSSEERTVVTLHEMSHLRRRHHVYVQLAALAAAANPLLFPVVRAIRLGVERWADEDAAAGVRDRRAAGRALARIALLRNGFSTSADGTDRPAGPVARIAVAEFQVASRVSALLAPAPREQSIRLMLAVLVCASGLVLGIASMVHVHAAIEIAELLATNDQP